jgi:hypothetical protein
MSNSTWFSETKRALLQNFLRADPCETALAVGDIPWISPESPAPLSFIKLHRYATTEEKANENTDCR